MVGIVRLRYAKITYERRKGLLNVGGGQHLLRHDLSPHPFCEGTHGPDQRSVCAFHRRSAQRDRPPESTRCRDPGDNMEPHNPDQYTPIPKLRDLLIRGLGEWIVRLGCWELVPLALRIVASRHLPRKSNPLMKTPACHAVDNTRLCGCDVSDIFRNLFRSSTKQSDHGGTAALSQAGAVGHTYPHRGREARIRQRYTYINAHGRSSSLF
jgi:hypothetical protein